MHRSKGMTLVEMVISTALLAGMMTAAFAITASVSGHSATQRQIAERRTAVRTVLTRIANDVAGAVAVEADSRTAQSDLTVVSLPVQASAVAKSKVTQTGNTQTSSQVTSTSGQSACFLVSGTATEIELTTAAYKYDSRALWVRDSGEKDWAKLLDDVVSCRWQFFNAQGEETSPPGRSDEALDAVHRVGIVLTATVAGRPATFEMTALPWCRLQVPSDSSSEQDDQDDQGNGKKPKKDRRGGYQRKNIKPLPRGKTR